MFTDFMPANPLRPLDHRWQLARCLVENPMPVRPRWIDAWTRRARRFHRIRQKRLDLSRRFHPDRVDAEIHQALQIQHQPRRRLELEARLLAGQDDDTIAQRLELPPDLVELYDRLFFDVRDHRNGRDFILARILGSGPARGQLSREQVVHLIAYMRGPVVVDGVLEVYDTPEKSALFATETQSRLEMDPLRLLFEIKQLGAWGTLPVPVRRLAYAHGSAARSGRAARSEIGSSGGGGPGCAPDRVCPHRGLGIPGATPCPPKHTAGDSRGLGPCARAPCPVCHVIVTGVCSKDVA